MVSRFISFSLALLTFPSYSVAFCPQHSLRLRNVGTFMSDAPSDTSPDPFLEVKSERITTDTEAMVSNVLDTIPSTLGEVSESDRAVINEVILKLEALNPTVDPALSPLLNGEWELRYSGGYSSEGALQSPTRQLGLFLYSGGYSPGVFAMSLAQKLPQSIISIGEMRIEICKEQPRIQGTVDLKTPLGESTVVVKSKLISESGIRLRETYESAEVMGRNVELPEFLQYSRDLFVTYVDEDLLVVRDGSGIPELLVRPYKTSPMY